MKDSIKALRELEKRLYAYQYAMAVADYDSETVAPPESSAGRAEAMEVLSRAYFDQLVSADTAALLQRAAADAETEQEKAEVRELQRSYDEIGKIPAEEYAAFTKLTQESMPAWGKAKRGNDFASFAPYLEKIVESLRAQAHYFAPDRDPYEVWLDRYEHGLTIAQCDTFFAALRETIVPLLAAIKERGSAIRTDFLYQDWPIEQQRKLSKKIMEVWGLDPDHCVLGETEHPFTSGFWHGDVRITTHYMPQDMFSNLYSVAHEGGHALYELNVDPKYDYTILAGGATTGLHESQSRLFENIVGRSRAFVSFLYPTLREIFPDQLADVTAEEVWRAVNRAEPGLIRTEADELTYALHIMVRYELEMALMDGDSFYHPQLDITPLCSEETVVACSPDSPYGDVISPKELDPANEIVVSWRKAVQDWRDHWFGLTATPLLYADSMQAVDTFLGNEMMWAIVPLAAARALAQEGRARICYLTDPAPDRVSYLMTRRGEALSPAAQLLLEDIRTEIQRIEGVHMVQ